MAVDGAIVAEGLGKKFGRTVALADVSFSVPLGGVYALVGANGAGKSTLIKLLMNIHRPTAGWARVLGVDSHDIEGRKFCRIGYVSENQKLPDEMRVEGLLRYLRPFYPTWDVALEGRLLRLFDLPVKRKLKHLSRGMRMKAAFVASLAYRPEVVVLDEPLSGLDPLVRDELMEGLLREAAGTTVLVSSHDLAEIEGFATHVGFIEKGRMLFSDEMGVLKERFRAVTVVMPVDRAGLDGLTGLAALSGKTADDWSQVEAAAGAVQLVHRNYRGEASEAEIRAAFPDASEIRVEAMPLRSIFLAVARAGRAERMRQGDDGEKNGGQKEVQG